MNREKATRCSLPTQSDEDFSFGSSTLGLVNLCFNHIRAATVRGCTPNPLYTRCLRVPVLHREVYLPGIHVSDMEQGPIAM